jgi:hypothetical protein
MRDQKNISKRITLTATLAASITAGKFALSWLPNIEIVTLLICLYAVVFGLRTAFPAVTVFCLVEGFLFGFSVYLILYLVYWNMLALFAALLAAKTKKALFFTAYAVLMTVFFGVLSTALETLFFSAASAAWRYFVLRYFYGIPFFVTQIICNAVLFPAAFAPLRNALEHMKNKYFLFDDVGI